MRFSTFALFASTFTSSLAAPPPQTDPSVAVDSLVNQTSVALTQLISLNALGAQIAANASTPDMNEAIRHINNVVKALVPVHSDGFLDGVLGGGGGLGDLLGGNGGILKGLLPTDLLGGLLGGLVDALLGLLGGNGGLLGGLLGGNGGLLGGLLGGNGGLLGGLLGGGGGGGLLGGLLGGGGGGLLDSVTGLLNLSASLNSSCGPNLVAELLELVKELVATLNGILPGAQQCYCRDSEALGESVAALIKANMDQLAPN
ncbi:hypothetical protein K438DRAFT_768026 [Mycena galopus ATCC 62051]|nr:hypothetical protein K438DRAFT_768026 [Mycena galopus ATCC 62051]